MAENEWREREEPKVRYEQYETGNPMDAVRGKRPNTDEPKATKRGKKAAAEPEAPRGNEYRERVEDDLSALPTGQAGGQAGSVKDKKAADNKKKEAKKAGPAKRPNLLVQVLNGDILTRDFVLNNLTFIFFILFLLMLMVGKGYYGKQLAKDIDTLDTEVRAKTAEYIENKARLEEATARYRLVEALEKRGLKETVNPAKVIRLKHEKQ